MPCLSGTWMRRAICMQKFLQSHGRKRFVLAYAIGLLRPLKCSCASICLYLWNMACKKNCSLLWVTTTMLYGWLKMMIWWQVTGKFPNLHYKWMCFKHLRMIPWAIGSLKIGILCFYMNLFCCTDHFVHLERQITDIRCWKLLSVATSCTKLYWSLGLSFLPCSRFWWDAPSSTYQKTRILKRL